MATPLPTADAFGRLVSDLMGKRVKVAKGAAFAGPSAKAAAVYVDAEKQPVYAAIADAPFLAGIGAALAMIPPALVAEAIRAPKLPANLVENAYEVLNIAASVFNEIEGTPRHVKIESLLFAPLAAPLAAQVGKPVARLDLVVGVPGYPDGKLSLLALR